ncbi:hypothetical protein ACVDG3_12840 [Meridianimarinicoccus sp. RP-17]
MLGLVALALSVGGARADLPRDSASAFAGQMTDNTWQDILIETDTVRSRDAQAVGVSVSREWAWPGVGFYGVEGTLLRHFGEQEHWEIAVPVYLRSLRPDPVWLPSLAYGLGLSHATDVPESEIARRGESQRTLAMWFIELEFGGAPSQTRPYLRLHHRSDAFGLFPVDTGSNVLVLGVRRDF